MKIDYKLLKELNACESNLGKFVNTFPSGIDISDDTKEIIVNAPSTDMSGVITAIENLNLSGNNDPVFDETKCESPWCNKLSLQQSAPSKQYLAGLYNASGATAPALPSDEIKAYVEQLPLQNNKYIMYIGELNGSLTYWVRYSHSGNNWQDATNWTVFNQTFIEVLTTK